MQNGGEHSPRDAFQCILQSCLPTHVTVTLSKYTLIPTVYRALQKSAVSGIGHWIHTTKKMHLAELLDHKIANPTCG